MPTLPHRIVASHPLWDETASRQAEAQALADAPAHALMARAGTALGRLAQALAPHSPLVWIACGPGNNGGDGVLAALHLRQRGYAVWVTRAASPPSPGSDAQWALEQARQAGLPLHTQAPPEPWGLAIDALFGLGARPGLDAPHLEWLSQMRASPAPLLCADVPSGLHPGNGRWFGPADRLVRPSGSTHTLSLLTLKSGLYTSAGRDAAGQVWFDDLGARPSGASASLLGPPRPPQTAHDSHKGRFGHVWVIGGDQGLSGAAWLAAQSALRRGAGRVHVQLLSPEATPVPRPLALMTATDWPAQTQDLTVVAGCGGGRAIAAVLPRVLSSAPRLVLDADALNAMANDPSLQTLWSRRAPRGHATVITPHPLEAARLLGCTAAQVQADRLQAAQQLAQRGQCVVVLKGSGSVIAAPDGALAINPSGNPRLASAGSGDVLAGWIGARLAHGESAWDAACAAVYLHGAQADQAPGQGVLIADDQ